MKKCTEQFQKRIDSKISSLVYKTGVFMKGLQSIIGLGKSALMKDILR